MPSLTVKGKTIELDDDGHLKDMTEWSEEVAQALAERDGLGELTDDHLKVLHTIRNYYLQFKVAPMVHLLAKECGKTYRQLHTMFKKQPGKRAAKFAGLPKATGCT